MFANEQLLTVTLSGLRLKRICNFKVISGDIDKEKVTDCSPGPGRFSFSNGMFWLAVSAGIAYILLLSSNDLTTYSWSISDPVKTNRDVFSYRHE